MQKKWRKTGVALLIAGLAVSGTGYALADGGKVTEVISLSELHEDTVEKSPVSPVRVVPIDKTAEKNNVSLNETEKVEEKVESDKDKLPEIPEGYTAGNLAALAKAYEQVQNPNAKASIKRNMERAIAKWESKQPVTETPKEEVKEEAPVKEDPAKVEEPVKEDTVKEDTSVQEEKSAKVKAKNPQAELNAKHKEQKEELKAVQKAEREALKEERKVTKEQQKQEKKEKKNGNEN